MSVYIKPTFSLTANSSDATTEPGPMSFSLNLNTSDTLTVTGIVFQEQVTFADATSNDILIDASDAKYGNNTETPGSVGSYIYFKNIGSSGDVYIGTGADNDSSIDLSGTDGGATEASARLFTLQPGEFAWMPYDYALNILADSSAAATLEYWLFDKA